MDGGFIFEMFQVKPGFLILPKRALLCLAGMVSFLIFCFPGLSSGRIYIDINAPSIPKFKIAIPDFKRIGGDSGHPELGNELLKVMSSDLELSGYFSPIDKGAFLEEKNAPLTGDTINFKDWSVIGAELLLKVGYSCMGSQLQVELRLYDVFWGKQILGKRALTEISGYRHLMHNLSNEIILKLTGYNGISLTKLAYVGDGTGQKEIYICDFDGYNTQAVTSDKSIAMLPRWSPDGKMLAYNSYKQGGAELYLKNMVTGVTKRVSRRSGLNIGAAWSPNGEEIALTLSDQGNSDIYEISLEGRILKRLTDHWSIDVSPSFSPDGKRLAFVSNRSGSPQVYILTIENGKVERLTFDGKYNTSPSWSRLNKIAYTSMNENGSFDICTIDPNGGPVRVLTGDGWNDEDPCWSPDGRYIAFSSNRTGSYHIYIMNLSGQNQSRITFQKGNQTSPSWVSE